MINKPCILITIVIVVFAVGAYFVLGTRDITNQTSIPEAACEEVNLDRDYSKLSHEECLNNEACKFTVYLAFQNRQREIISKFGSSVDPNLEFDARSTLATRSFPTKLQELTNGEAVIPDHAVELSADDLDGFEEESIKRPPVIFLRKTFDDYISGKEISIFSENMTRQCHIVSDTTFGLDGFDEAYYRSRFTPFAIFKHIGHGYDIFLLFADKPDRILRAWVSDADDEGNFQLKTIEDAGVPKDEVLRLYNSFKKYLINPKFSI
ncbi:MAG: hypothetical protein WCW03_02565 [Candidatus Paceibacterota bacterium]